MSEDIKDLVKRLRVNMHAYGIAQEAADKLEMMADLLLHLRSSHSRLSRDHRDMLDIICAERDRMKAALVRLRDCDWVIRLPDRMDGVRQIARKALGDKE